MTLTGSQAEPAASSLRPQQHYEDCRDVDAEATDVVAATANVFTSHATSCVRLCLCRM